MEITGMADTVRFLVHEMLSIYGIRFTDENSRNLAIESWAKQFEAARPEGGALKEAIALLESCRQCDLVYDYKYAGGAGDDGRTVAEVVDAFLARHQPQGER